MTEAVMDKTAMEQAARNEFWNLDGQIRAVEAQLETINQERNLLVDEEAIMRAKLADIKKRKLAIVEGSNIVALAQERSRYAVFLKRKTGTRDKH